MTEDTRWRLICHMVAGFKITYFIGTKDMAVEQARMAFSKGVYQKDARGVVTYYPPSAVEKVKLVPPGVELDKTEHVVS